MELLPTPFLQNPKGISLISQPYAFLLLIIFTLTFILSLLDGSAPLKVSNFPFKQFGRTLLYLLIPFF